MQLSSHYLKQRILLNDIKYFSTDTAQGLKGVLFTVSQLVLQVCYHLPSHHLLEICFCHNLTLL